MRKLGGPAGQQRADATCLTFGSHAVSFVVASLRSTLFAMQGLWKRRADAVSSIHALCVIESAPRAYCCMANV